MGNLDQIISKYLILILTCFLFLIFSIKLKFEISCFELKNLNFPNGTFGLFQKLFSTFFQFRKCIENDPLPQTVLVYTNWHFSVGEKKSQKIPDQHPQSGQYVKRAQHISHRSLWKIQPLISQWEMSSLENLTFIQVPKLKFIFFENLIPKCLSCKPGLPKCIAGLILLLFWVCFRNIGNKLWSLLRP